MHRSGPHQQHHGPAQLVPHAGNVQHFRRRLRLFHRFQDKAAMQQSHQDLGEGMVLLADLAAQKVSDALPGHEILIDGPVQRRTIFPIGPILSHTGGKNRMLDVE